MLPKPAKPRTQLAAVLYVPRSSKETTRAKAKVWNARDLDRLRSIPPPPKPSVAVGGTGGTGGGRVSAAIQRLSAAGSKSGGIGGSSRKISCRGAQDLASPPPTSGVSVHRPHGVTASSTGTERSVLPIPLTIHVTPVLLYFHKPAPAFLSETLSRFMKRPSPRHPIMLRVNNQCTLFGFDDAATLYVGVSIAAVKEEEQVVWRDGSAR